MKTCAVFLPLIILLAVSSAYAQTPTPAPWPPDPERIFVEGVDWQEIIEPTSPPVPRPEIDNETRIIRIYDATQGTWREYPFPDAFDRVTFVDERSDGTFYVWSRDQTVWWSVSAPWPESNPADLRILDAATGVYTRPQAVCKGRIFKAAPGEGRWVIAVLSDEEAIVCQSETGEMLDILPDEGYWAGGWSVRASPDGTWLLLVSYPSGPPPEFHILAYNMENNLYHMLGSIDILTAEVMPYVCGWVSDTQGLICTGGNHNWQPVSFYSFDVTQPDSLTSAYYAWEENTYSIHNPKRYAALLSTEFGRHVSGGGGGKHNPCTLIIYDSEGLREHELAYECVLLPLDDFFYTPALQTENTLYYLTIDSEDATASTLEAFDLVSETQRSLQFTTEIETILSISPDQRYIVLLLDDSGELDAIYTKLHALSTGDGRQVVIFDQEIHAPVYISEPVGVYFPDQVRWLDDNTVFITATGHYIVIRVTTQGDTYWTGAPSSVRRITLRDDGTLDMRIMTLSQRLTAYQSPLLRYSGESPARYLITSDGIFDMLAFEPVSILRDDIPRDYSVELRWAEDSTLRVTVRDKTTGQRVDYRVMLP